LKNLTKLVGSSNPRRSLITAIGKAASKENQTRFHLPDGPSQQARDAQIRDAATDWFLTAMSWIYGHDAAAVDDVF
jgi:hypothetical protein